MYAAAIVLGFRASFTWALPILTKVTPGHRAAPGSPCAASGGSWASRCGVTAADRRGLVRARSRAVAAVVRHHRRRARARRRRRAGTCPSPLIVRLPIALVVAAVAGAHRPGVAAAGRRHAGAARAVAELARDPRRVRAAVAGARRPRRRGAGLRDRRARGRALVTASVSATAGSSLARFRRGWGRLGRALEHPAVMPGIAVAGAVFVVAIVSFAAARRPADRLRRPRLLPGRRPRRPVPGHDQRRLRRRRRAVRVQVPAAARAGAPPGPDAGHLVAGVPRRVDGAAARVAGLHGTALDAPAPAVPARARRAVARQPQHPARARDRARDALARRRGRSSC